jgi:hypothetical protein
MALWMLVQEQRLRRRSAVFNWNGPWPILKKRTEIFLQACPLALLHWGNACRSDSCAERLSLFSHFTPLLRKLPIVELGLGRFG